MTEKPTKNAKGSIITRSRIAFVLMSFLAIAIVVRIFLLQNIEGEKWRSLAEQKRVKRAKVLADRGNIYANDEQSLLATSLPFYRLAFDPLASEEAVFRKGVDSLAMLLSRFYKDRSEADYRNQIITARKEKDRFLYLNRKYISYQDKKKMLSWPIFREGKMKGGVIFEKIEKRYNPFKSLALRTIGYFNEGQYGVGLEKSFDKVLAGSFGISIFRQIAGGHWKPILEESLPVQGKDIVTTLDINLQDVAQASLEKHLRIHNADNGCVVVMDVKTGEIRALANLKADGKGNFVESYNYAIGNRVEPGSTFKLASYMALLEEDKIRLSDSIDCEWGKRKFYDRIMTDSKPGGYGRLSIEEAFAKSSNIAISKLIFKHFQKEPTKYLEYLEKFGLKDKLQFPIDGFKNPKIKNPDDSTWSGTTLPWMSIGYESEMTPLQILTFYNTIANGGRMVKPILVKKILNGAKVEEEYKPEVLREQICSEKTLEAARKLLELVVENGTAVNIRNKDYKIAGKTGTARKLENKVYQQKYYTSFAGYFPAEKPKFSIIVTIDNPKGYQQYGADVAAPVFKEIADKVYARDIEMHQMLLVSKEQATDELPVIKAGKTSDLVTLCNLLGISNRTDKNGGEFAQTVRTGNGILLKSNVSKAYTVPDVRGLYLRDALYLLENKGIKVKYEGVGRVQTQSISPNARKMGSPTIYLKLSL